MKGIPFTFTLLLTIIIVMLARIHIFIFFLLVLLGLGGIVAFFSSGIPQRYLAQLTEKPTPSPTPLPGVILTGPAPTFPLKVKKGYQIGVFASSLGPARDLEFSPNGTLLTTITSQGEVLALPDKNRDGIADTASQILSGLNKPHGIAFYKDKLYIAEETRVSRYSWDETAMTATFERELFQIPKGGNHTTRSIIFDENGRLFVSIGSTCNVCIEKDPFYAAIIVSDSEGATPRLYATGLRNSVFMSIHPLTRDLWATDMGRDFLGDFNPPDEINIIKDNHNYGWPICWGNKTHDTLFDKNVYIQDPCSNTEVPQYGLTAHSAPLGLTFVSSKQFPENEQNNLIVAQHGSWNRTTPIGYKVLELSMSGNNVTEEKDLITGFLARDGSTVLGRPVDVIFDLEGSLYISDDKAGQIYKMIQSQ